MNKILQITNDLYCSKSLYVGKRVLHRLPQLKQTVSQFSKNPRLCSTTFASLSLPLSPSLHAHASVRLFSRPNEESVRNQEFHIFVWNGYTQKANKPFGCMRKTGQMCVRECFLLVQKSLFMLWFHFLLLLPQISKSGLIRNLSYINFLLNEIYMSFKRNVPSNMISYGSAHPVAV